MDIKKKSVLFICPVFFGYELSIKQALIENGYSVDLFDERTSNNSFLKAVFRVKKDLLKKQISKHYADILNSIRKKQYDFFFLIKGEVVPESFILDFKELNPTAKLIYYTYDSIKNNNTNSTYILKHFDCCYSFDFEDVKVYPELKIKHLFYTKDFIANGRETSRKHDISFVGTLHSNRFSVMKALFGAFEHTFLFYYMPAKWFFLYEKATKKEFKPIKISDVSFDKLTKAEVAEIFKSSKSVLDIQRFGQTGLTMRTFEVLAAGSILVTTNQYIKQTDFYDENSIVVIDNLEKSAENTDLIKKRIATSNFNKTCIPDKLKKYHINTWVNEFFEN